MISASSAIISGLLRVFGSEPTDRPGTLLMRRIRNQVRLPTDQDIPELRPVLVEFVDQSATRGTADVL